MTPAGKTFLVTGGMGFLGSGLVRGLLRAGAKVRSLDDDSRGARRRLADVASEVELLSGDVRDLQAVTAATRGVECVCHLAYLNGTEFFYSKPDLVLDIAVRGMMNVLDACRSEGVRELVLASSSEVYQTPAQVPTDESASLVIPDPQNPRYSYGGGKIISELLSLHCGSRFLDRVVIVRPHNVYGPDMGREHVIPELVLALSERARSTSGVIELPIQGSGAETRAFVFIDDLVNGLLCAIERGEHRGIYHVGSDSEISIEELVSEMARFFGREVRVLRGELRHGSPLRRCPDIKRIRALGYHPRVTLREGLSRTIPWYVENRQ